MACCEHAFCNFHIVSGIFQPVLIFLFRAHVNHLSESRLGTGGQQESLEKMIIIHNKDDGKKLTVLPYPTSQ
jgi:hypothetical protein